jgi:penicillin-binding protein 2
MAEEMLVNKHGAIVALDPNNGEILVLATGPDIDPNLFTGIKKRKTFTNFLKIHFMITNQLLIELTSSLSSRFYFQIITALAAMQMGVIDENTIFPCGRGFYYRGLSVKGHGGAEPLIPSIQVSSNCYFSYAFIKIMNKYPGNPTKGVDEWKEIMESFGLNKFMNNDLAVGAKGRIPSGEFYEKKSFKIKRLESSLHPKRIYL